MLVFQQLDQCISCRLPLIVCLLNKKSYPLKTRGGLLCLTKPFESNVSKQDISELKMLTHVLFIAFQCVLLNFRTHAFYDPGVCRIFILGCVYYIFHSTCTLKFAYFCLFVLWPHVILFIVIQYLNYLGRFNLLDGGATVSNFLC